MLKLKSSDVSVIKKIIEYKIEDKTLMRSFINKLDTLEKYLIKRKDILSSPKLFKKQVSLTYEDIHKIIKLIPDHTLAYKLETLSDELGSNLFHIETAIKK